MKYKIYGPFDVPHEGNLITRFSHERREFWDDIDGEIDELSNSCGCYVFTIGNIPWYVGKAEKQSFRNECFSSHKMNQYNIALKDGHGIPRLFLVARITPAGDFTYPSKGGHQDIQELEKILIGFGLSRNQDIRNIKGTKTLREINVPGLVNSISGQANSPSVKKIKKVFLPGK